MSELEMTELEKAAKKLYEAVAPHFSGVRSDVIGFVLADLTATWINGHHHPYEGGAEETRAFREELLEVHIRCIREFVFK